MTTHHMATHNLKRNDFSSRASHINKCWDEAVGPAHDEMPPSILPTQRDILRRYRRIRTDDPEGKISFQI